MIERLFKLSENNTNLRTEVLAGVTTFLTMAYIIFVQPAVLSGKMFGTDTGIDFGAVTTATCLSAALATAIMAIYARYPIAQAPGMGENFFFVFRRFRRRQQPGSRTNGRLRLVSCLFPVCYF
jgi:adenine/guanine/hypoxanthine permease